MVLHKVNEHSLFGFLGLFKKRSVSVPGLVIFLCEVLAAYHFLRSSNLEQCFFPVLGKSERLWEFIEDYMCT